MNNLLLPCIFALLFAASFGLGGTLEANEECEACTKEQSQRGLCKPCRSDRGSTGKHSMYRADTDEEDYDQRSNVQELRIVLIGHTGSGKSATANTILGGDFFKSQASAVGITTATERKHAQRFGRDVHVVDTPGLFDPSMTNEKVIKEITKCIGMTAPGPHAFILVVQIGRFTKEVQDTVTEFKKYFGQQMMNYLIVLFTRVDDLGDKTLDDYLVAVPPELADLLQESSHRYIGFNNKASTDEKNRQARALLKMIDDIVAKNGGSRYTNEIFQEAEKAMKRQEMALRREMEEKNRKEREAIEREFTKKAEEAKKKHDGDVIVYQNRIKELESIPQRGNQEQLSLAAELAQLRAQLMQMEKQRRLEEERRVQDTNRRIQELERRQQKVDTREVARRDLEMEGDTLELLWTGLRYIAAGMWKGVKKRFF